jgi:hypothetical protein
MKLFIDDDAGTNRPIPKGWASATTYWQALEMLEKHWNELEVVSFDHDLACFELDEVGNIIPDRELDGYKLMCWVENKCVREDISPPFRILVHSYNPEGAWRILRVANKLLDGQARKVELLDLCRQEVSA